MAVNSKKTTPVMTRQDEITAYIARDYGTDYSAQHKEHLIARASVQENWYANKRARRMLDAPTEVIPAGTTGYCLKIIPKDLTRKSFILSAPSKTDKFRWKKDSSNLFKYEVVPIKLNMNQYRGWKTCLFATKEEAEAYKAVLMNTLDTNFSNPYIANKL